MDLLHAALTLMQKICMNFYDNAEDWRVFAALAQQYNLD